jgi:hypothetical protein
VGNPRNDQTARNRFRKKLESWGMPEEEIQICVDQYRERQRMKRNGTLAKDAPMCTRAEYVRYLKKQPNHSNASVLRLGEDYQPPSDKGYKPVKVDSLLNGTARATGNTAKAVKKGKTITKYQYDKENP